MAEPLPCFKRYNTNMRDKAFKGFMKSIELIILDKSKPVIAKIKSIVDSVKKQMIKLYRHDDLKLCDEDDLEYLTEIYSIILDVMKKLKLQSNFDENEDRRYKIYHKEVESILNEIKDHSKELDREKIAKIVRNIKSKSTSIANPDMYFTIPEYDEPEMSSEDELPRPPSNNPFATGNARKYEELKPYFKERSNRFFQPSPKKQIHVVTPPKNASSRTRSRSESTVTKTRERHVVSPPPYIDDTMGGRKTRKNGKTRKTRKNTKN